VFSLFLITQAPCPPRKPPAPDGIPQRYVALYRELEDKLNQFAAYVMTLPGRRAGVTFGGEILPANSHRGEGLLAGDAYAGVLLYVDRLSALGARAVSVHMGYPLLTDTFPRSAEYWAFYRRLAGDIRNRGLKLHVKTGPIFNDREFSSVPTDYSNLTVDGYFRDQGRIVQRIAAEIRPDYLSIGNEPSSEMQVLRFAITPDRYAQFVRDTLASMNRSGIMVGAGSGNWDSVEYIQRFVRETSLDFIDLHIYPLAGGGIDFLRRAVEMADIAFVGGKRIIIGECWLYKAGAAELVGNPTLADLFARDVFGFWAPLDIRFLQVIAEMASLEQIEYVSPFWTKYLFAYIDFDNTTANATPLRLTRLADEATVRQLLAGAASPTGSAYRQITAQYR